MVGSTTRNLLRLALALVALALLGAAPALGAVESKRLRGPAVDVREYWTPERMRRAEPAAPAAARRPAECIPLPGTSCAEEVPDSTAPDVRAHGKVYFTAPNGAPISCSGTAVRSRNRSVVWTAGHCVFSIDDPATRGVDESGFASNWIFVPAYHEGEQPFGQWVAKRIATTGPWRSTGNYKYDLGAAVVRHAPGGSRLHDVVGARGIAFDRPRRQIYRAFGYPAESLPQIEFTGERQYRCLSPARAEDDPGTAGPATIAIRCDMTAGASGGGWIVGGRLLSVTSYGYGFELDRLYGPYMSTTAKALYRKVRGKPKPKGGRG